MKNGIAILLAVCAILIFCACGQTESDVPSQGDSVQIETEMPTEPKSVAGTYQALGLFDEKIMLRENTTFDVTSSFSEIEGKGTYTQQEDGGFHITYNDNNACLLSSIQYHEESGYYYSRNFGTFTKDTEYGLTFTTDSNGRSNQKFESSRGNGLITPNRNHYYEITFNTDGTCNCSNKVSYTSYMPNHPDAFFGYVTFELVNTEISGTYTVKDSLILITSGGVTFPMIIDDGEIYFYVMEKIA